jgi:transcriptional regulator with XRE-family HTH domain
VRVEEIVGRCVRHQREELKMTQVELGNRLQALLGKRWTRQAVSAVERGGRTLTSAELAAIALALDTRPKSLLMPPLEVRQVELSGGGVVQVGEVTDFSVADQLFEDLTSVA